MKLLLIALTLVMLCPDVHSFSRRRSRRCYQVDGHWSRWGKWSDCGCDGKRTRTRTCDEPKPSCNGRYCKGDAKQVQPCVADKVDGGWTSWSKWSFCTCDYSAKTGIKTRSRSCTNPRPSCGGSDCDGPAVSKQSCYNYLCCKKQNGGWSSWSDWGRCDCTARPNGLKTRTRSCNNPKPYCGGSTCSGPTIDSDRTSCKSECCKKTAGGWTAWSEWGVCTCNHVEGTGSRSRTRSCTNPAPSCNGSTCAGEATETESCGPEGGCCKTEDGGWSVWGAWGACLCNHTDGTGVKTRSRSCSSPAPSCGGRQCPGLSTETGSCDADCCKTVQGGWSEWRDWGSCKCNNSAGSGNWTKTRYCNNPVPQCGGGFCVGEGFKSGNCDEECCQTVNGGWTDWRDWNKCVCDHRTGSGSRVRSRSCSNPAPLCHGAACQGDRVEYGICVVECCKSVNGGWTPWGAWSTCICNHDSGTGTRMRTRTCTNPAPYCHGSDCGGDLIGHGSCDDQCCKTVNGNWTEWGSWSTCICDHTTGKGTRMRTRSCTNPAPFCHGADCAGDLIEHGTCDDQCCTLVNGNWTDWGSWSTCICNHDSGTGTRMRTRTCTNPAPTCHGADCQGELIEHDNCDDQCCNVVDGGWTDWGSWGVCTCQHSSTSGTIRRERSCTNPAPSCHGKPCEGKHIEEADCDSRFSCIQGVAPVLDSSKQLKPRRPKDKDSNDHSILTYSVWVLAGLVLIGIIVGTAICLVRRRRKQPDSSSGTGGALEGTANPPSPPPPPVISYQVSCQSTTDTSHQFDTPENDYIEYSEL